MVEQKDEEFGFFFCGFK